MNINQIIEIKKEFTIQLTNILSPLIFEGISQIYNELKEKNDDNKILKNFQILLLNIKEWNHEIIINELNRIMLKTKSFPYLIELIQSVFKTTQIILGVKISDALKNELNIGVFIHHVYIECAREFYTDPYLFYHMLPSIEIKRNNNSIILKINCCIENAIRRLLPMATILDEFLGDKAINSKNIDNINDIYNMPLLLEVSYNTEANINSIPLMVKQTGDTNEVANILPPNIPANILPVSNIPDNIPANMPANIPSNMVGGNIIQTTNNKILELINNNDIKLSDSNDATIPFVNKSYSTKSLSNKSSSEKNKATSTLKNIIDNVSQLNNHMSSTKLVDSKVKNNILKELDSESITYNMEANVENYQDIFSNSEIKKDTVNTVEKNEKKNRQNFFNNYLNI